MLKRVVHSLGLGENTDKNPRRKSRVRRTKTPSDFGLRSKDLHLRIFHEGGQQEVYHHAFPASKLMAKYPWMCVARGQIFMTPHQAVLRPEENLLLGLEDVIISCRDLWKLECKYPRQGKTKERNGVVTLEAKVNDKSSVPNEIINTRIRLSPSECNIYENDEVKEAKGLGEEKVGSEMDVSQGAGYVEEVQCSAKNFYVAKDKSARYSSRKGITVKKPFSPPLPKGRPYRVLGW